MQTISATLTTKENYTRLQLNHVPACKQKAMTLLFCLNGKACTWVHTVSERFHSERNAMNYIKNNNYRANQTVTQPVSVAQIIIQIKQSRIACEAQLPESIFQGPDDCLNLKRYPCCARPNITECFLS
jgi:hypothetical protein